MNGISEPWATVRQRCRLAAYIHVLGAGCPVCDSPDWEIEKGSGAAPIWQCYDCGVHGDVFAAAHHLEPHLATIGAVAFSLLDRGFIDADLFFDALPPLVLADGTIIDGPARKQRWDADQSSRCDFRRLWLKRRI